MAFPAKKKPDFLDDVVDEMGPKADDDSYGASMDESGDGDGMDDESDPEEAKQDRIMAAKQVAKALGMPNADGARLADALAAFVKAC